MPHGLLAGTVSHASYAHAMKEDAALAASHRLLPMAKRFRVLYLVQGRHPGMLGKLYAMLASTHSDVLFCSFATKRPIEGVLHFPGSIIGEGRNLLFLAARQRERWLGWRFHYLVFLDDDVL